MVQSSAAGLTLMTGLPAAAAAAAALGRLLTNADTDKNRFIRLATGAVSCSDVVDDDVAVAADACRRFFAANNVPPEPLPPVLTTRRLLRRRRVSPMQHVCRKWLASEHAHPSSSSSELLVADSYADRVRDNGNDDDDGDGDNDDDDGDDGDR